MQKNLSTIKSLIIVFTLTIGLSYVFAFTGPLHTAPTCLTGEPGCDAPINVSATAQSKNSALGLGKSTAPIAGTILDAIGNISASGLLVNGVVTITGGSPAAGKVLTSDATGLASWQTPTGGSGTGGGDVMLSHTNLYTLDSNAATIAIPSGAKYAILTGWGNWIDRVAPSEDDNSNLYAHIDLVSNTSSGIMTITRGMSSTYAYNYSWNNQPLGVRLSPTTTTGINTGGTATLLYNFPLFSKSGSNFVIGATPEEPTFTRTYAVEFYGSGGSSSSSTVVCGGWTVKYNSGYVSGSKWGCATPDSSAVSCPVDYDNITSSAITINLAEQTHLCVLHSSGGPKGDTGPAGPAGTPPIVCKQTGSNATRDLQVTFTAANCGGTLPDSTYVGMAKNMAKDCGMISFNVIQAGETGYLVPGPGVTIYGLGACPTNNYTVGAVFIKK
ncbi:MAG: hypothetical protein V4699_00975 [Patescibacteria group bacterium]